MYKILYTVIKSPINAHHTSKGLCTIPTDSCCISNKRIIHHVCNHRSCLAKKVFSQNPPSNFNLHYFSSHTFLTGRYPHHHSNGSKQRGKDKLQHILCAKQYKFHRFLLHISVKCCTPDKTCTHSIASSRNVFLMKIFC